MSKPINLLNHTGIDILDRAAIVDHWYNKEPGWALASLDDRRLNQVAEAILAGLVNAVPEGDEWRVDLTAFSFAVAIARIYTQGLGGQAHTPVPGSEGEGARTVLDIEADCVEKQYRGAFMRALKIALGA